MAKKGWWQALSYSPYDSLYMRHSPWLKTEKDNTYSHLTELLWSATCLPYTNTNIHILCKKWIHFHVIYLCVCACAPECIYVHHVYAVPAEVRREYWTIENWSYWWLWIITLVLWPKPRYAILKWNFWAISQALLQDLFFKLIWSCRLELEWEHI